MGPDYKYAYLFGALFFLSVWLLLYCWRSNRAQLRWGGLVAAPFALTGVWFVPEYWHPCSVLYLLPNRKMCLEDWIWSFAVGGIASVTLETLTGKRMMARQPRATNEKRSTEKGFWWEKWSSLILIGIGLFASEAFVPEKSIYNMILVFLLAAAHVCFVRRDLAQQVISGGVVFGVVYLSLFLGVLLFYPEFVSRSWNLEGLWGLYVMGVPLEEVLFAATGGAVWTVGYEFTHGFKQ